ncbi:hypothetical protein [Bacillus cereus]|uniref:hypothetical protein n=1 Tax=Bacillus cereus TaxID=1396 RepID=UPI001C3F365C|nr:hypothetical protein [Bacillus cereus]
MDNKAALHEEKNKLKKRKILLILLLVAFIGSVTLYVFNSRQAPEIIAGDFLPDEKDAKKMNKKQLAEAKVDASNFTLSVYPEAVFEEQTGKGLMHIRNEPSNAYPINVKVQRNDTKEVIYETGAIQPGHEIKEVTLKKPMEAGEYKATANVDIFDPKTKKKQGTTQAEIQITVKK